MALDGNDPTLTGGALPAGGGTDPPWDPKTREYIGQLRRENAAYRLKARDGDATLASENRALRIDVALHQSKDLEGLDLKYVKFLLAEEKALDNLDPNAADFPERLQEKLSDLLGRHPQVKAGATRQIPTTSGVPAGGPGGNVTDQLTLQQVRAMTPDQVAAAHASGKTSWLLGRR